VIVRTFRGYQMARASPKINFLIDSDLVEEMEGLVPAGKRSRVVNDALRKELELIKRKSAVGKLLSESRHGRKMSTEAIVTKLSSDRKGH
jgi:hypothetical protein